MKKSLLTFILSLASVVAFSQQNLSTNPSVSNPESISGTVEDVLGNPLMGVNVIIKGTRKGVETYKNGRYVIKAKNGNVLVFSFVGMETQEVTIENTSVIDVVLYGSSEALEEVVVKNPEKVIRRKERARSYSATTITSEQIRASGYTNIAHILTGTVPGFYNGIVRPGSTFNSIQPLYVLDGAPIGVGYASISGLIPNIFEIESIEVIKSMSGAIKYGPRAVGGVVAITTKFYHDSQQKLARSWENHKYKGDLKVKEQENELDYLSELSKANSAEEAYKIYESQNSQYGHLPSYHMDAYDYFKKWNNREYGLRILFNEAAIGSGSLEQLKALAYQLEAAKEYHLATNIYTQILKLYPQDFQSYRDLALSYKNIGLVQESRAILNSLATDEGAPKKSDVFQFSGLDDILRNDALPSNNYSANASYDIRIVADWNRSDVNINLQVIDPTREVCYYENPTTKQGGQLAQNMFLGYGPEEFTLKNAKNGSYYVMVNYTDNGLQEPTYLKLTLFKNYGKPNQTKEVQVIRLDKTVEGYIVSELKV